VLTRAVARVNLAAVERNCRRLGAQLAQPCELGVVVKADGYGHGALPCARAAQAAGASWLALATAAEAAELRAGGIEGRLLVMGALTSEELDLALGADADVVAWREGFIDALAARGHARVHVKLDTGMGRLGTRDPAHATRLADRVADSDGLALVGAMTHFATADERGDDFFGEQLAAFGAWVATLRRRHPQIIAHAANSAATLRDPASHFDMVRCGVGVYGLDPFGGDAAAQGLEPALALHSYLADVKPCAPGQSAGYGRRFIATAPTCLAVAPIGYGDGWRRGLSNNSDVLIGGRRHPLVGTVSMDNITVDVGPEPQVAAGDLAVLIGSDGSERISAEEVAARLDTINYEITCGLLGRVPRAYHRDGVACPSGGSAQPAASK